MTFNGLKAQMVLNHLNNNESFLLTAIKNAYWEENNWIDIDSNKLTYNDEHLKTQNYYFRKTDSGWINNAKTIYNYDDNQRLISKINWFFENEVWTPRGKTINEYDLNNNLSKSQYFDYTPDSNWLLKSQTIYEYDENHNNTLNARQTWSDNQWINDIKYTYTYTNFNKIEESYTFTWNDTVWLPYNYSIRTYSEEKVSYILSQKMENDTWVNATQLTVTYKPNSTLYFYEKWDNGWTNKWLDEDFFDSNNNVDHEIIQTWNEDEWINEYRFNQYYESIATVQNTIITGEKINVYPNPSNGIINIKFENTKPHSGNIEIFNEIGQLVFSKSFNSPTLFKTLDLRGLVKGNYILKIITKEGLFTKKINITK